MAEKGSGLSDTGGSRCREGAGAAPGEAGEGRRAGDRGVTQGDGG